MLTLSERDLGTSEDVWRASTLVTEAAPLDWASFDCRRVVVVAPHPDDETLGAGGSIAMLARAGSHVVVLAVTDGEGSHPRSPTTTRERMAEQRREEQAAALAALGIAPGALRRLAVADGAVERCADLDALVTKAAADAEATLLIGPLPNDGHPDHDAAGRATLAAALELGKPCLGYPVWLWHWATPDALAREPRESRERAATPFRASVLDDDARERKARAIRAHRSQVEPLSDRVGDERLLPPAVLARFTRPFEIFVALHDPGSSSP